MVRDYGDKITNLLSLGAPAKHPYRLCGILAPQPENPLTPYFSIGIHHKYRRALNMACAGFCGGGEKERILKINDFQDSSANCCRFKWS